MFFYQLWNIDINNKECDRQRKRRNMKVIQSVIRLLMLLHLVTSDLSCSGQWPLTFLVLHDNIYNDRLTFLTFQPKLKLHLVRLLRNTTVNKKHDYKNQALSTLDLLPCWKMDSVTVVTSSNRALIGGKWSVSLAKMWTIWKHGAGISNTEWFFNKTQNLWLRQ